MSPPLGSLVQSFFGDYLPVQKGLRLGSIRSYRDTMSLLLRFLAKHKHRPVAKLVLEDLTLDSVLGFLAHLEHERGNSPRTRNQRRAALTTFFSYLAVRVPDMLAVCQQIASIPVKRTPLPDTHYLEREEMTALLRSMPRQGPFALRDRTLVLFLYNTGARAQEVVDLRVKWRLSPLWSETVKHLEQLLAERKTTAASPVFCARRNYPLTRFGVYKIIRRHAAAWDTPGPQPRRVSPHLFRHTAATHLLESGVEVNVIRGWLGHVSLDTTNRYAELMLRAKTEALRNCELGSSTSEAGRGRAVWKEDKSLLTWLSSL
jgi:site-specific recombinase XerD